MVLMMPPTLPSKDKKHLRVIMICHYVSAGLALPGIASLIMMYSKLKGYMLDDGLWEKTEEAPPFDQAFLLDSLALLYTWKGLLMVGSAILYLISARSIQKRKRRTLSMVIAIVNGLRFPLGTVLAVFTLIVLSRDSVAQLYNTPSESPR